MALSIVETDCGPLGLESVTSAGGSPAAPTGAAALADYTRRAFDYEHTRTSISDLCDLVPARQGEIVADLGLPRGWFAGKRVLDAGCGAGRWAWALASLGAQVTAIDFTASGVAATREALAPFPGCRVVQADLTTLDLGDERFDLVMSWGVLHHTADPPATFRQVMQYVAPGGYGYVMVYGHSDAYAPHQEVLTDVVRQALRHLSPEDRWEACKAFVLDDPQLHAQLWPHLYLYYADPADETAYNRALCAAYDCFSPAWNFRYAGQEVEGWFRAAGFREVTRTRPYPDALHYRGRRPPVPPAPVAAAAPAAPAEPVVPEQPAVTVRLLDPESAADAAALAATRQAVGWETRSVGGQLAAQARGQRSILLAFVDGAPAGSTVVEWDCREAGQHYGWFANGRTHAHHNDLCVMPAARPHGVATALMDAAQRLAVANNRRYLCCQVPANNSTLIRLYERRGNRFGGTSESGGTQFVRLWLDLEASEERPAALSTHFVAAYDCEVPGKCLPAAKRLVALHEQLAVPATFFVVGTLLRDEPDWVPLLSSPLFEVASHTYSHGLLRPLDGYPYPAVPDAQRVREVRDGKQAVEDAFQRYCLGLRPATGYPDGLRGDPWLTRLVRDAGYAYVSAQIRGQGDAPAALQAPWRYPHPDSATVRLIAGDGAGLWELPTAGRHCTQLRAAAERSGAADLHAAWRAAWATEYLPLLATAPTTRADGAPLPYLSFVWHPWNLGEMDGFDTLEALLRSVQDEGLRCTTFAEQWRRLEHAERPAHRNGTAPVSTPITIRSDETSETTDAGTTSITSSTPLTWGRWIALTTSTAPALLPVRQPGLPPAPALRVPTGPHGRPLRIALVGNIAHNAYLLAKFLRARGVDAESYDEGGGNVIASPWWEDAVFDERAVGRRHWELSRVPTENDYQRPPWAKILGHDYDAPWYDTQEQYEAAVARIHWAQERRQWQGTGEAAEKHPVPEDEAAHLRALFAAGRLSPAEQAQCLPLVRLPSVDSLLAIGRTHDLTVLCGPWAQYGAYFPPDVPYLTFEHATMRYAHLSQGPADLLLAYAYYHADHTFITNADCHEAAGCLGLDPARTSFLPHPLDTTKFSPGPSEYREEVLAPFGANLLLLAPARHSTVEASGTKRTDRILWAYRRLVDVTQAAPQHGLKPLLLFMDWGDATTQMRELVRRLDLQDYVDWGVMCAKPKLLHLYRGADLVLDQFSDTVGSFGAVTIEALACGKPLITYLDPRRHDWVLECGGLHSLPPVANARATEEIAAQLIDLALHPDTRQRLGEQGRAWIEANQSEDRVCGRFLDACAGVLARQAQQAQQVGVA